MSDSNSGATIAAASNQVGSTPSVRELVGVEFPSFHFIRRVPRALRYRVGTCTCGGWALSGSGRAVVPASGWRKLAFRTACTSDRLGLWFFVPCAPLSMVRSG